MELKSAKPHDDLPAIDPDEVDRILKAGRTLPAIFYTNPEIHELEQQVIFRRSWQIACTAIDLSEPGDYVTLQLASVPIVIVRGEDLKLRAFVNVCRHRAGTVMHGEGQCKRMQCAYHGWTYGLDGSLKGAPGWREGNLPPFETLGLASVALDTWAGLVFVCLEPERSLVEQLGEMPKVMQETGYDFPFANPEGIEFQHHHDFTVRANWKIYQENSSECYHCPTTHTGTFAKVFRTQDLHGWPLRCGTFLAFPLSDELEAKFGNGKAGSQYGYAQYFIWPNSLVVTGHVGEAIFRMEPLGPGAVQQVGRGYGRPDQPVNELTELIEVTFKQTTAEDKSVVEGVQVGLESGYFEVGPTLDGREDLVRHFYRQVWDALSPAFR